MSTKRSLIAQAFDEFGLAEYVFDATPEELQSAFVRLQRQMTQWDGIGIRTGYILAGNIDAESGLPDTAENAVALNLAVACAPSYGKVLSVDTKVAAKMALNALMTALQQRPEVPYPRRLPIGTGNDRDVLDPQYFGPGSGDAVPGLNDGALEY